MVSTGLVKLVMRVEDVSDLVNTRGNSTKANDNVVHANFGGRMAAKMAKAA